MLLSGCVKKDAALKLDTATNRQVELETGSDDSLSLPEEEVVSMEENMTAPQDEQLGNPTLQAETAVINTSKGIIKIKLYREEAPKTVMNFTSKASSGFYNGLTFHRVEDWVIQGGDPKGNGTGGGKMPTELNDVPFVTGSVGVARGMDINFSNDSQFFICTTNCNWLTGQYTNFGEVVEGMDLVRQIEIGDEIQNIILE